jgi:hypothetical protein
VERVGAPEKGDVVFLLQFFNTPGNEIAPGSNVIVKDLQDVHVFLRSVIVPCPDPIVASEGKMCTETPETSPAVISWGAKSKPAEDRAWN